MEQKSADKNNVESLPVREPDNETLDAEMETGKCFASERGGRIVNTLELQIPEYLPGHRKVITCRGIPYSTIEDYKLTPEGIILSTDRGITITIEGNRLKPLFDALLDHKLRRIRPANKDEDVGDEPEPKNITIDDGNEEKGDT